MGNEVSLYTKLITNAWIVYPMFGISVAIAIYAFANKFFDKIISTSLGKKAEVMKHMKLLGMEVDERKVTQMLLVASFGIGGLFFMLAWPVVSVGLLLGVVSGTVGFHLVPLIFKILYDSRCDLFADQMVDALTIMANGIKSGSNVQQSMAMCPPLSLIS